jgi:Tfp pilus assembly protein PilF
MPFAPLTHLPGVRVCAIVLALSAWVCTSTAAPRIPLDDNEVLEKLPLRAGDTSLRELTTLRAALASSPADANAAAALAQAYFDLASARGDPRYVGYAEAVVIGFPGALPAPLLLLRGMLGQYRHNFAGALKDFSAALAQDPELATAHSWRAAIFLVMADYSGAQKECNNLQRLGRKALFGACMGLAQAYAGQLEAGYQTLQLALTTAKDPDQRLWFLTRLGEVAAWRGKTAIAEQHYREALSLGRDDGYLLAAWTDFLLDTDRPAEVVKVLAPWEASDGLLLRLAQAEANLNLPGAVRHAQALQDRFAAARLRSDTTHQAEEARFRLLLRKDSKEAVRLASENFAVQREPRDARILLEAAIAAQDAAAAQPALEWLRSSGFEDARLQKLGRESQAMQPAPASAKAATSAGVKP